MKPHTPEAAAHAGITLTLALMKHLHNKGILDGSEGATILNLAIKSVKGHSEEQEIVAVIKELLAKT
jgi:hypothetical protein